MKAASSKYKFMPICSNLHLKKYVWGKEYAVVTNRDIKESSKNGKLICKQILLKLVFMFICTDLCSFNLNQLSV